MDGPLTVVVSLTLILINALLVAAEMSLVGSRKSKLETLSQQGNRRAALVIRAIENASRYVASIQVGITICGLGLGLLTEPLIGTRIAALLGQAVPSWVSLAISLVVVSFVLVVLGELIPKLLSIRDPERVCMSLILPLRFVVTLFGPLAAVTEKSAQLALRPFGIRTTDLQEASISREELALLVRTGGDEGALEESHASVVSKALKFDKLDAADIMIHRVDIRWLDIDTQYDEVREFCAKNQHSRIPVCRGDVDDVAGVLYVQDLFKVTDKDQFSLAKILRQVELIPENLTLNKVVNRMRDSRTQLLVVIDEYGGTSGLVTLEDVVEEVFGELEDQLESERPPIERVADDRISARSDVRYDEILEFLELDAEGSTETLAQLMMDELERVPKLGDRLELPIGTLLVENMVRSRITRCSVLLKTSLL